MEEGTLIQRLYDVLSKVEYGGGHNSFKHMKTCPCCGVFAPKQFGTSGIHKPDCELFTIKELMNELLRQTELDLHRDNMWYGLDTGQTGFSGSLIRHCEPSPKCGSGTYSSGHLITHED